MFSYRTAKYSDDTSTKSSECNCPIGYPQTRPYNTGPEPTVLPSASSDMQCAVQDPDVLQGTASQYLEELVVVYRPTRSLKSESESVLRYQKYMT